MRCRWCLLRQHFELCVIHMFENDRMPALHLSFTSTDEKAQLTVCNTRGAVCDLTKRSCRSGRRLVRRRYRRRPRASGRLHAPSGIRQHRATLRAAELRPASPPKPSVKKRAPPLWNRCTLEKGRTRSIDEGDRKVTGSLTILW